MLEDKANNMEGRTENWEETGSLTTLLSPEDYLASGLFIHVSQRATPTPTPLLLLGQTLIFGYLWYES